MSTWVITHGLAQLVDATNRARRIDPEISTTVKQGKFQVVRVKYDRKGKSTVTPVSAWMDIASTIRFMERICAS